MSASPDCSAAPAASCVGLGAGGLLVPPAGPSEPGQGGWSPSARRRVLVVDDNPSIHDDIARILRPVLEATDSFDRLEADLIGKPGSSNPGPEFEVHGALQGADGVALVERSLVDGQPFEVAFIDMRMPPGLDGIETALAMWRLDPRLQVVICTAYSDYSWQELVGRLGHVDRLLILKKPFGSIEVRQIACALSEKWRLARTSRQGQVADPEVMGLFTEAVKAVERDLQNASRMLERLGWNAGGAALAEVLAAVESARHRLGVLGRLGTGQVQP